LMAMGMNKRGRLISVDQKDRSAILDVEYSDLKPYCTFIKGNTHEGETMVRVAEESGGSLFDILFIDAGHTYEDAKSDFETYSRVVRPGGLVLFHDTCNTDAGVDRAFAEITWEKFNLDWGWSRRRGLVPGFGICRKPYEEKHEEEFKGLEAGAV
jgi:hypothetical protein